MKAYNITRNVVLADRIREAGGETGGESLFRAPVHLSENEGLWVSHAAAKKHAGPLSEFDALFVDAKNIVVGICERFRGYGVAQAFLSIRGILELPAGKIERTGTLIGDKIEFREYPGEIL